MILKLPQLSKTFAWSIFDLLGKKVKVNLILRMSWNLILQIRNFSLASTVG